MSLDHLADAHVTLAGAWLPGQENAEYFPLPDDHIDQHQLEMRAALQGDDTVILNTNPTGGGKTLSWAGPVIREGSGSVPELVIATYPTTALIQDQRQTLLSLFRQYYGTDEAPWVNERSYDLETSAAAAEADKDELLTDGATRVPLRERVVAVGSGFGTGPIGDQLIEACDQALETHSKTGLPTLILTTPDTLTLLATNRFGNNDLSRVVPSFDAIVVDEFHLATERARRLLPFHLDVYNRIADRYLDTFVFLSATPEPSYVARIERAFEPTRVVNTVSASPASAPSTRQILPSVRFGITSKKRFTSGQWLANNVDTLAAAHEPPGQLLVIVDSIREVETVTAAFESETDLSTGRVYGWKKEGRQQAITDSDVVVGNRAVEVGVDFDRVNRLVCTGYEPSSTLQRLGRMRHRSRFDNYQALLITHSDIHNQLVSATEDERIDRTRFDEVLHAASGSVTSRPYYDLLCGAYTRYLWEHADRSLDTTYAGGDDVYRTVAFEHFGPDFERFFQSDFDTAEFWDLADRLLSKSPTQDIFERLHSYRPASLDCLVIDVHDEEERLKSSSLYHVLRHREGEVIPVADISDRLESIAGRALTADERAFLTQQMDYAVAGFVATGRCESPRDYYLSDFAFVHRMRQRAEDGALHRALGTIDEPDITTDPGVPGVEHIELGDEQVLAQFVPESTERVRARFRLGPYAALVPTTDDETLALWDDAIKVHAQLVAKRR